MNRGPPRSFSTADRDPRHGAGQVSLDGVAKGRVDARAAARTEGQVVWASPRLANGRHRLVLRHRGDSDAHVPVDRAVIRTN